MAVRTLPPPPSPPKRTKARQKVRVYMSCLYGKNNHKQTKSKKHQDCAPPRAPLVRRKGEKKKWVTKKEDIQMGRRMAPSTMDADCWRFSFPTQRKKKEGREAFRASHLFFVGATTAFGVVESRYQGKCRVPAKGSAQEKSMKHMTRRKDANHRGRHWGTCPTNCWPL